MKNPSLAASYAALYPGLSEIARKHGYALAIHGSMARDLDLIAVPWTDDAAPAEVVAAAIKEHAGACSWREINEFHGVPKKGCVELEARAGGPDPHPKAHGRLCWSLHLDHGAYIDLSVVPQQDANPWIRCSDRMPTSADADFDGGIWIGYWLQTPGERCKPNDWLCWPDQWQQERWANREHITHWRPTGIVRPPPPQ